MPAIHISLCAILGHFFPTDRRGSPAHCSDDSSRVPHLREPRDARAHAQDLRELGAERGRRRKRSSGRNPTSPISPRRTLSSCGNSSSFVRARTPPDAREPIVTRQRQHRARRSPPHRRNLNMMNLVPPRPTRVAREKTGPGSSMRIASETHEPDRCGHDEQHARSDDAHGAGDHGHLCLVRQRHRRSAEALPLPAACAQTLDRLLEEAWDNGDRQAELPAVLGDRARAPVWRVRIREDDRRRGFAAGDPPRTHSRPPSKRGSSPSSIMPARPRCVPLHARVPRRGRPATMPAPDQPGHARSVFSGSRGRRAAASASALITAARALAVTAATGALPNPRDSSDAQDDRYCTEGLRPYRVAGSCRQAAMPSDPDHGGRRHPGRWPRGVPIRSPVP